MKLLTFQARRFWWKSHVRTLDDVEEQDVEDELRDAVVVFIHAEEHDAAEDRRASVFRKTLKHIKWLANKRDLKAVALHSFTHLGGKNAEPAYAQELIESLRDRLASTGYEVKTTPFGHFCEWSLDVFGESLAKVWKEI